MERLIHAFIFVGALQALFFAGLIGFRKSLKQHDKWLLLLLLCLGLSQLLHFLRWDGYLEEYLPFLLRARFLFPAFVGALFYGFILRMTGVQVTSGRIFLILLPGMINLLLLAPYLILPAATKIEYQLSELFPLNYYAVYLISRASLITFAWISYRKLSSFAKAPVWLIKVAIFLLVHSVILAVINIIDFFFYEITSYYYINLASTLFVFVMIYFSTRHSKIYLEVTARPEEQARYEKSGLSPDKANQILRSLDSLMVNEHLYRQQGITQGKIAHIMNTSSNHLSQALNEQRSQKFTDYLNAYRVKDVKKRMANKTNDRYTLLALAEQSGFGSKASFNTVFKKHTGQTPTEYFKSIGSVVKE
ncbi:MAG: helix-turn-helix domain-containing protein [Bacteroidota bacterium]